MRGGVCSCALFLHGLMHWFCSGAIRLGLGEDRFACLEFRNI